MRGIGGMRLASSALRGAVCCVAQCACCGVRGAGPWAGSSRDGVGCYVGTAVGTSGQEPGTEETHYEVQRLTAGWNILV